jgi:preprotein translocase subunit SecB
MPRESGLTPEKSGTESFGMIHEQNTSLEKVVEQYYFHFRVEQKGVFRIFGYQKREFFCITHIDRDGIIHHS